MDPIVYRIANDVNDLIYVGCTLQAIEMRWKSHLSNARGLVQYQTPVLNRAMHNIGVEHFSIELIETCKDRETMLERERYWIRQYNCVTPNGYNVSIRKLSDEQIATLKENTGNLTSREYAELFGVAYSTIRAYKTTQ